jgi:hypothetical protein
VYKSVGADGKVMYSDHPSDQSNVSVSIIKADIVQSVPMAAGDESAAPGASHTVSLAAAGIDAGSKDGAHGSAAPKKVCDKMINVVVGANGEILRILPSKGLLAAFKAN